MVKRCDNTIIKVRFFLYYKYFKMINTSLFKNVITLDSIINLRLTDIIEVKGSLLTYDINKKLRYVSLEKFYLFTIIEINFIDEYFVRLRSINNDISYPQSDKLIDRDAPFYIYYRADYGYNPHSSVFTLTIRKNDI